MLRDNCGSGSTVKWAWKEFICSALFMLTVTYGLPVMWKEEITSISIFCINCLVLLSCRLFSVLLDFRSNVSPPCCSQIRENYSTLQFILAPAAHYGRWEWRSIQFLIPKAWKNKVCALQDSWWLSVQKCWARSMAVSSRVCWLRHLSVPQLRSV